MTRKVGVVLLLIGTVGVALFFLLRGSEADTAVAVEDLTTKALDPAGEPATRERAVLALAEQGPAGKEALKSLLKQSADPVVKSSALMGLTAMDAWDGVPLLIAALEDPSEAVRARAGVCVVKFIGKDYGFNAAAPLDQRNAVIQRIKTEYAKLAASPPLRYRNPDSPSGNQP